MPVIHVHKLTGSLHLLQMLSVTGAEKLKYTAKGMKFHNENKAAYPTTAVGHV